VLRPSAQVRHTRFQSFEHRCGVVRSSAVVRSQIGEPLDAAMQRLDARQGAASFLQRRRHGAGSGPAFGFERLQHGKARQPVGWRLRSAVGDGAERCRELVTIGRRPEESGVAQLGRLIRRALTGAHHQLDRQDVRARQHEQAFAARQQMFGTQVEHVIAVLVGVGEIASRCRTAARGGTWSGATPCRTCGSSLE
jgi:hypothetical protein